MDKQKDKIKKLLELSLSDNENEAQIALRQAMSLMNKHNITKDEVYGQAMANKIIKTPYYRVPGWYSSLHYLMAKVSGCFCVYQNGDSYDNKKATIQITGRERDVDNAEYLIVFLSREIEKSVRKYKKELTRQGIEHHITRRVTAYRIGFINKIYKKIHECQHQFFTSENTANKTQGNEIICIDVASRVQDAQTFYTDTLGQTFSTTKSQARYLSSSMEDGNRAAAELEINNAVHQQDSIKKLAVL